MTNLLSPFFKFYLWIWIHRMGKIQEKMWGNALNFIFQIILQLNPDSWMCIVWIGFPGGSVVKNPPARQETQVGKIPWRRKWQPSPVFLPGNPMDRGAWWARSMGLQRVLLNLVTSQQQQQTTVCIAGYWGHIHSLYWKNNYDAVLIFI